MHHSAVSALVFSLLSALPGAQAGLYTRNSPVIQVEAKDYDRLIARSNKTSIVEFYAPWCGHCQNLKPVYEKVAKNLEGIAKVAAVNCDDDANKSLCGTMGVQGFPTLKIVRPQMAGKPTKRGPPAVEDYQGARTAAAMVEAVTRSINDYVKKIDDKSLDAFLKEKNETAKAILFTEKGTTSALLKSVALDFLDVVTVAQVRSKQTKAVELFGVDKFPTLILLPGGEASGTVYDGEMKRPAIVAFLSQVASPNPDAAPPKAKGEKEKPKKVEKPKDEKKDEKKDKKKKKKKEEKTEEKEKTEEQEKTDDGEKVQEASSPKDKASDEAKDKTEQRDRAESEGQVPLQEAPVLADATLPIPAINTREKLVKECLNEKSHTCVLAFVPSAEDDKAKTLLTSLGGLALKYAQGKRNNLPFFEVRKETEGVASLLKALDLGGDVELIALNARRGWWRHFEAADPSPTSVESWIDAIRLSEGVKRKLPEGIVAEAQEEAQPEEARPEEARPEAVAEPTSSAEETETVPASSEEAAPLTPEAAEVDAATDSEPASTQPTDPTVEAETATEKPIKHEEL